MAGGKKPKISRKDALKALSADFDKRLESLNDPHVQHRIDSVMAAQGKAKRRPKSGET